MHKLLHPSQTRWLSLHSVVSRIVEQWNALVLFFNDKYLGERLLSAEQIHKALNDPYIALYFKFLDYILPKFNRLNAYFQNSKAVIFNLHAKIKNEYIELLLCYMNNSYVTKNLDTLSSLNPKNASEYKKCTDLYLGTKLKESLTNAEILADKVSLEHFYKSCLSFLSTACYQIKLRFDFGDPLLSKLEIFLPTKVLKIENRLESLNDLLLITRRFAPAENWQNIDDEWRKLAFYPETNLPDTNLDVDTFWANMLDLEVDGEYMFKNLSQYVLNLLCLPHSNADCERVFSKLNLIKTKTRNRLITNTINGTILASQYVCENGGAATFNPDKKLLKELTSNIYKDMCDSDI